MKKYGKFLCAACAAALATTAAAGAAAATANPSAHKIYLDGERVSIAAYTVNGNNYFKIRDVAAILSGTNAQFDVTWDAATGNITLTDDKAYTKTGDELYPIPDSTQVAKDSTAPLYRDSERVYYTGYSINNNNYYKLRDIAEDFDFGVTWDGETQSVYIKTDEEYVPEGQEPTVEPEDPDPVVDPDEPETPVEDEQPDDTPISADDMKSPPVGEYSEYYQNYLDNCSEEIVTCTINYITHDQSISEYGNLGGFEATVWTFFKDSSLSIDSPFDDNYPVYSIWVDESGSGSFQLKMPKSLYEGTIDGKEYFFLGGARTSGVDSGTVEIDGKMRGIGGGAINDKVLRKNNPDNVIIEIINLPWWLT